MWHFCDGPRTDFDHKSASKFNFRTKEMSLNDTVYFSLSRFIETSSVSIPFSIDKSRILSWLMIPKGVFHKFSATIPRKLPISDPNAPKNARY